MPAAQVRYLTGAERELWSERCIWDAALKNIRVVVSTYQVLLDGLSNGFVHLSTIPILVFDEGTIARAIPYPDANMRSA